MYQESDNCCCCTHSTAVKWVGFGQLWAALFFWACVSNFELYYWAPDFLAACVYTLRVVGFLNVSYNDS